MNRAYVKKLVVSTLALSFALGGGYIASAKSAGGATGGMQSQQTADNQQGKAPFVPPRRESKENHKRKGFPIVEEAASILGIDQKVLKQELDSGKSIVDVAQEKGISEADLTAKLLALRSQKIDEAVKAGKLDANRAEQMKQRMSDHLKFMLNEKGPLDRQGAYKHQGMRPDPEKLAQILGMSKEELTAQLKAGKSLSEIAASKGISRDQLISKIKDQLTPYLEKMVDRKKADAPAQ